MDEYLNQIKTEVYDLCAFETSDFSFNKEGKEYNACRFILNGKHVVARSAKITPKKVGQFVTFWKRNNNEAITPFHESDPIDFYVVNVRAENNFGQFVFPRSSLIKKGIISTAMKEGKRAFRVYPKWDITNNKQAKHSQKWQLEYFFEVSPVVDLEKVSILYKMK